MPKDKEVYTKGTTAIVMERQFRAYYEMDLHLPTAKIVTEIAMEQKKANLKNALDLATEAMQNIQHNLSVAQSGATILRNAQDDSPDANKIKSGIDQQTQGLNADIAALIQEAAQLNKSVMSAFDHEQIKAILKAKADDIKKSLAKAMEDNLVRQQTAVEKSLEKYTANVKTTFDKSITIVKHISHVVQSTTGQSLPKAPAGPSAAPAA